MHAAYIYYKEEYYMSNTILRNNSVSLIRCKKQLDFAKDKNEEKKNEQYSPKKMLKMLRVIEFTKVSLS